MIWYKQLQYDPIKPLLESGNEAIIYFTRRDLLKQNVDPVTTLWSLKQPVNILKKQLPDGSWKYPGKGDEYRLLQTFKNLQQLVYKYEFDCRRSDISAACAYLFSYQTDEGDIRGFIGNQYAPYYTGIVSALLTKAGYEDDHRIEKALEWLLKMRQNDGGWVIGSPGMLGIPSLKRSDIIYLTSDKNAETAQYFDRSQPFSHSGTGMVIRAFAAHRYYKNTSQTLKAANLLKSQFFKEDNYSSYRHPDHWIRFQYPFWWNNLLAALDSLSLIGLPVIDKDIAGALEWFVSHQRNDGLWDASYSKIHKISDNSKTGELRLWITLSICRIFTRFYG